MHKTCTKCKKSKPKSEFHKDAQKSDGLRFWCKACAVENVKQHNKTNPKLTKHRHKVNDLKRYYGLSYQEYESMLLQQKGCCAICKLSSKLVVDHSHLTGQVRKLLCNRCNLVLGSVKEDVALLKDMIEYLQHTSGV